MNEGSVALVHCGYLAATLQEAETGSRLRLCGELALEIAGRQVDLPRGQAGLVFAFLAVEGGAARSDLIDLLWPHDPPRDPEAVLSSVLSRLRRVLGEEVLRGKDQLRLDLPGPVWSDIRAASGGVDAARRAAASGDWRESARSAGQARTILARAFVPGYDGEWVNEKRGELEDLELEALELAAHAALQQGGEQLALAERAARALVLRSPYRERGHRLLMEALAAQGNIAEALRVYEEVRTLLRDELGAAPAPELAGLHQRLLTGDTVGPRPQPNVRLPLPDALAGERSVEFLGRERELEALGRAWARVCAGRRAVVLVGGEPGIGKSRLTAEFARQVHAEGATVLFGRCYDETLTSYQPFVEALQHYVLSAPLASLREQVGERRDVLERLLPGLGDRLGARDAMAHGPPDETQRYVMFEAVASLLAGAAARTPLLLVIDDLHWADQPTTVLLKHVTRALGQLPVMVLGTYRETELARTHPFSETMVELRRDDALERVRLSGLGIDEVFTMIARWTGGEVRPALGRAVLSETEGNPFFVLEVLRHLDETGALDPAMSDLAIQEIGVPEGVKQVIGQRLSRLSRRCNQMLAHASVLGREFEFGVLAQMTGFDEEAVLEALEDALAASLIVEVPGTAAGVAYAFTHALVRETLYAELSLPRKQRMHLRAAEAIEAISREASDSRVSALARHFRLAGGIADPQKAIRYSLEAAQAATRVYAWEEATLHWSGAIELMEEQDAEPASRAQLLVTVGDLVAYTNQDLTAGKEYLERAIEVYEELGDEKRAAQTRSRLGRVFVVSAFRQDGEVGRAFECFDRAEPVLTSLGDSLALAQLHAGRSLACYPCLAIDEGLDLARRGMDVAERLEHRGVWGQAAASYGWHLIVNGRPQEGLDTCAKAWDATEGSGRWLFSWVTGVTLGNWLWALGDVRGAEGWYGRLRERPYINEAAMPRGSVINGLGLCALATGNAERARAFLPQADALWISISLEAALASWDGDAARLAQMGSASLEAARNVGSRWNEWGALLTLADAAWLSGRLEDAVSAARQAVAVLPPRETPFFELWSRPMLALLLGAAGQVAAARSELVRCQEILDGGEEWRALTARVLTADAATLVREGRTQEASHRFERACEIFEHHSIEAEAAGAHEWYGRALRDAGDDAATPILETATRRYAAAGAGDIRIARAATLLQG